MIEETAAIIPASSETGMNAPERPPTLDEANSPPFLTASFNMARATVLPGTPMAANPRLWKISPTLSPTLGVGARDKSTTPNPMPSRWATSRPISSPTRVTL